MNKIQVFFAASNQPGSLGSKFRAKRFAFFEEKFLEQFNHSPSVKILDVGGTESFWQDKELISKKGIHITLLNREAEPVNLPNMISLAGDATDLSEFGNKSFDLVFSNSVIEHLENRENQKKMAQEVQRVGKKYFVQTPNKYFFIEPHYGLPFFQFVPKPFALSILTKTKLSRLRKWGAKEAQDYLEEIRLLSLSEMKLLFPGGKVFFEKFMGLNKSFTLHNF